MLKTDLVPTQEHGKKIKTITRHAVIDTASSSRKHWIAGQARNDVTFVNCVTSVNKNNGFTLIEILLVLTMMAVVSALIAPSFFSASGSTVSSESRQLQKILRMIGEESQLSGIPIQLRVYQDHLTFYTPDQEKKWHPLANDLLQSYVLGSPVLIDKAQLDGDVGMIMNNENNNNGQNNTPPPLARFLFWPDGSVTAGEITLKAGQKANSLTIRIDAGAAGIRVMKQ